ncbi:precorrin-2 dehydrogenase/sirohydrochlorin ferrochelatase family protein [Pseudalkalibacillus decolorationis]|uniref:precorrin-2 dehydrogenase/sirohydrochlorin ferrochelatase family protein n=1 Tax=Pseudalkalibacillus decolorationis TaxID=163879 RepID=UPI00214878A4|nr:NAD(P)-dependent oxidoreductase [Pseudalkalibacillus decolorationis]
MTTFYPAMLRVEGKRIVIVGGGKIATRKVQPLIRAGACVTVISPTITDELQRLAIEQTFTWLS